LRTDSQPSVQLDLAFSALVANIDDVGSRRQRLSRSPAQQPAGWPAEENAMHIRILSKLALCAVLPLLITLALPAGSALARDVDHVIHISVDGANAIMMAELLAGDARGEYANFARIIDEGASTLNARTDFTYTKTLPNHTSQITGRPVTRPAGQANTVHHGYTRNSTPGRKDTLHNSGNPNVSYIASVFDVAHDHGLSTALYASKEKFVLFDRSYDDDAPDVVGEDDGADKIDTYFQKSSGSPGDASEMHAAFLADMAAQRFNYVFLHYRNPDSAGHKRGWGSPQWKESIAAVDDYLGDILALVEGDAPLAGRTAIILTSDHGGRETGHGDASDPFMYTIPFLVWGPGVAPGTDLYTLNAAARLDPGTGRPDYDVPRQPIRNGDSGNLALALLGLPPVPGSSINVAQDLAWKRDEAGAARASESVESTGPEPVAPPAGNPGPRGLDAAQR
jgi:hypothetical protein